MKELHKGLKAEIEFWQDLIIESSSGINSPEYRRLEHRLHLARVKLLSHEHEIADSGHQSTIR
jgi:hypothetical protein